MINALKSVLSFFSAEKNLNALFVFILVASVVLFVTSLTLSFTVSWFSKQKRVWVAVLYLMALGVGISVSVFNTYFLIGYVFVFCFDLFSVTVIMSLPEKSLRVTKEQKELVEFIDSEIQKENSQSVIKPILDKIIVSSPQEEQAKPEKPDIDFSHVGGILERLDYFPLSPFDKKQVNSLRASLLEAQNGKIDLDTKRRINDGLSDLLKIMSKYGV